MFNKKDTEKAAEIKELPIVFGSHGLKLKGKILLPKDSKADEPVPGAVLCHGFGAAYRVMEPGARIMAAQGIATLIFDFRGHGTSEGTADGKMVEDIVDTGMTLNYVLQHLSVHNPASLRVCALLDKRVRRLADVPLDYVGFEIPDEFVVGYGLDFSGKYRNLPFIGILE